MEENRREVHKNKRKVGNIKGGWKKWKEGEENKRWKKQKGGEKDRGVVEKTKGRWKKNGKRGEVNRREVERTEER